jgi:Pentacotripeptide-repeat region of PRORP
MMNNHSTTLLSQQHLLPCAPTRSAVFLWTASGGGSRVGRGTDLQRRSLTLAEESSLFPLGKNDGNDNRSNSGNTTYRLHGNDRSDKPATRSLLQEILQQQRAKRFPDQVAPVQPVVSSHAGFGVPPAPAAAENETINFNAKDTEELLLQQQHPLKGLGISRIVSASTEISQLEKNEKEQQQLSKKQWNQTEKVATQSDELMAIDNTATDTPYTSSSTSHSSSSSVNDASTSGALSIFDVFRIPDPPPTSASHDGRPRQTNAYPAVAMEHYMDVLNPIMADKKKYLRKGNKRAVADDAARPVTEWLVSDAPSIDAHLPAFDAAIQGRRCQPLINIESDHSATAVREQLQQQRTNFQSALNFSGAQFDMIEGTLKKLTNEMSKYGKGVPVEVVWSKVKEAGITDQRVLHNLLYISITFTPGSKAKRKSKYGHLAGMTSILDVLDVSDDATDGDDERWEDLVEITDEIAIYHDMLHEPNEQSINVRVKLLVAQGKAADAAKLLENAQAKGVELHLRSYTPVLRLFLELEDLGAALELYKTMDKISTVHFEVETFLYILTGFAERGVFRPGAQPIAEALALGYTHGSGPGLFNEIVAEMAREFFEISDGSAKKIYNAMAKGFPDSILEETDSLVPLRIQNNPASEKGLYANCVQINSKTGICPRSGVKLRLIQLEETEKEQLIKGILELARQQQELHTRRFKKKHPNNKDKEVIRADQHLVDFYNWLNTRKGQPYTTLVDGANIGYYHQNFTGGAFNFYQIKFVVDSLEKMGENPLVVLPIKYTLDWFKTAPGFAGSDEGRKQVLSSAEKAIRNELMQRNRVLRIPMGYLGKCAIGICIRLVVF